MRSIKFISLIMAIASLSFSCSGQNNNNKDDQESVKSTDEVTVYYFHNARRCATCKTVEDESQKAVKELYGDKVKFEIYNLDKETGADKAEDLGVSGQTLLISDGHTKINITNQGFMNARNNPEKLKEIIKQKTDPLLN